MSRPFNALEFYQELLVEAEDLSDFARERLAEHHGLPDATPPRIAALRLQLVLSAREQSGADRRQQRPSGAPWRATRYDILSRAGGRCELCGASAKDGAVLHVDHIKPLAHYPELAKDPDNLQALCEPCNLSKGASEPRAVGDGLPPYQ